MPGPEFEAFVLSSKTPISTKNSGISISRVRSAQHTASVMSSTQQEPALRECFEKAVISHAFDFSKDIAVSFSLDLNEWPNGWCDLFSTRISDKSNSLTIRIKSDETIQIFHGNGYSISKILSVPIRGNLKLHDLHTFCVKRNILFYGKHTVVITELTLDGKRFPLVVNQVCLPYKFEIPLSQKHIRILTDNTIGNLDSLEVQFKDRLGFKFEDGRVVDCAELAKGSNRTAIDLDEVKIDRFFINYPANRNFAKNHKLPQSANGEILNNKKNISIYSHLSTIKNSDKSPEINLVVIRNLGRFGNAMIEIRNAIKVALRLKIRKVLVLDAKKAIKGFLKREEFSIRGVNVSFCQRILSESDKHILAGCFFHSHINNMLGTATSGNLRLLELAQHFTFEKKFYNLEIPVIHIRSGGIFEDRSPHANYGQPPLAFYTKIIKEISPNKVVLVFENKSNPIINPLIRYCDGRDIEVEISSSSFKSDVERLMGAECLVCGWGTFAPVVANLGGNLKKVYTFNKYPPLIDIPNVEFIKILDRKGTYSEKILSRNWENSPEQRSLMISYPEDYLCFET